MALRSHIVLPDALALRSHIVLHDAMALRSHIVLPDAMVLCSHIMQPAVLSFCAFPMPWCGLSPSESLKGRQIFEWLYLRPRDNSFQDDSLIPKHITRQKVKPSTHSTITSWSYLPQFKQDNKEKQKEIFDQHHRVNKQFEIPDGSEVVITTDKQPVKSRVVKPANAPRSYIGETPSGEVRRNHTSWTLFVNIPQLLNLRWALVLQVPMSNLAELSHVCRLELPLNPRRA